ncbi:hypothetical protein P3S68_032684 [Capsicum galapagoense]
MHAFFDGYISGRSSLKQFVEKYEVALRFVHVEGPRSTQTDLRINTHAAEMLRDGDLDTMMYTRRDKVVKVGVAVADESVKVVEEVETMMQT